MTEKFEYPLLWIVQKDLKLAIQEAERMTEQYKKLIRQSFYIEVPSHVILEARVYEMNAQSYVIDLRNRGYNWALKGLESQRSISVDKKLTNQTIEENTNKDDLDQIKEILDIKDYLRYENLLLQI